MVTFKNNTGGYLAIPSFEALLKPGDTIQVKDGYALPRRASNGGKRSSIIQQLCPQLKPASKEDKLRLETEFAEDAVERKGKSAPRTEELLKKMGMAPEVAKLMTAQDAAELANKLIMETQAPAPAEEDLPEKPETDIEAKEPMRMSPPLKPKKKKGRPRKKVTD